MKYLTQKWYLDCQKGHIGHSLKACDEAKERNEKYFQRLYQERMAEYAADYLKQVDEEQLEHKNAQEYANDRYSWRLMELDRLPARIKDDIADIRVAALGYVTKETLERITEFCESSRTHVKAQSQMYWDYYEKIEDSIPKRIRRSLNRQHDAHVKRIGAWKDDYIIETEYGRRDHLFTFKNADIIRDIEKIGCLTWLYEEIYLREGGYEVHVLFDASRFDRLIERKQIVLTDAIIYAEDIEVAITTHELEYHTEFL